MNQIKQNQVIVDPTASTAYSPLPRDLTNSPVSNQTAVQVATTDGQSFVSPEKQPLNNPNTPAIASVDSQSVRWSDGRAVIDVVLNIDDSNVGYDYEIRMTKSAGSL